MAFFNIRQWIDRVSQFPNRRTLTNVEDPTDVKTYDLSRAEGEITTQGTAITGANLNDLENRIGAAFTAVEQAMPEANPAAEATASLIKLKVAGTVYEIEGGGEPQTGTIEDVAIASFSDGADDVPVSELIVDIDAVQSGSGTPSPDNVRQITGFTECNVTRTSKNLITPTLSPNGNPRIENVTVTKGNDNVILTTTGTVNYMCYGVFYSLKKGTYTFKYQANSSDSYTPTITIYRKGSVVVGILPNKAKTFTLAEDTTIEFRLFASTDGNGVVGRVVTFYEMQLELGSTATTYEPYNGNTYTVDFGQTVYGGSLDTNSGKVSLTWFSYLAKDINWVTGNRNYANTGRIFFYRFTTNIPKNRANCLCDILKNATTYQARWENMNVNEMQIDNAQNVVICVDVDTVAELKTLFGDSVLAYELATPIEIQLTPVQVKTLLNNNNIFADTGNIEKLVYFKTGCEAIAELIEAYGEKDGTQTVLLEASDWDTTTNTITVDVAGVTATSNQEILPLPATSAANIANNKALQACSLMDYGQAEGQITLYAENIPSVDLSIRVIVRA